MIYELMYTEYTTKDLHLAAYLKLKGAELLRIEKRNAGKTPSFFIFQDKVVCENLAKKFWDDGDSIDIKEYIKHIWECRTRVASIPYD